MWTSISLNAQNAIGLKECLKKAREYHPYFLDKQRIDKNRELRIKNINSMWLPQLNLNAQATYQSEGTKIDVPIPGFKISGSPLDQYKVTMDVNQVLFDGGTASAQKKLTESSINADLQQNETDLYKVNDQVIAIYFNTLLLQISKDVYTNMLGDLTSKEQKVSSGVRNGILIQSDLDNLKVEILKAKQMIREIKLAHANSLWVLSDITGDSTFITAKLTIPDLMIVANDSVNRPELKFFDIQKDMLNGSKSISSTQRIPKLYAFSQVGYGRPGLNMLEDDFQPYYIVGLKFQWNIWDWNKTSREKSIYSVQQEMIDSKRESYVRNINISGNNELTRIKQLENALDTDHDILDLRKSITKQSEKRLEQGVLTMTDYLTDYNAEIKAGLQLETHKIQLIQSKANYLIIKGIL
jgi:outer membrane protein TolC